MGLKDNVYGTKEKILGTAASVAQQVRTRTGSIGDAVSRIEKVVGEISEGWSLLRGEFRDEYTAMCVDVRKAGRAIRRKTQELGDYVNDNFYTDGDFDTEKARDALRNQGEAARQYGVKFCRTLGELVEKGKEAVVTDFKKYIPSDEELKTRYAGIGTEYNGTLLKPHYDACLNFMADAESKISPRSKFKGLILDDIKASASSDVGELRKYYASVLTQNDFRRTNVPDKLKALERYFL